MAHWEEHTCIRFIPKAPTDRQSIYIYNTRPNEYALLPYFQSVILHFAIVVTFCSCSSFVGRIFYYRRQGVSLGANCVHYSIVVHELGHVIGLYHEHNRPDRDNHILVYPDRHYSPQQLERQQHSNTLGFGYDYASIMHYDELRGALQPRIKAPFGNAEELSPLDIAKVIKLYRCGEFTAGNDSLLTYFYIFNNQFTFV